MDLSPYGFIFGINTTLKTNTGSTTCLPIRLPKHAEEDGFIGAEGIPLRRQESLRSP